MKYIRKFSATTIAGTLTIIGIVLLWIYKFPFLRLPFFWDEAWSYATAVYAMQNHHICLLPGCLSTELYRGHPLWFYFMNAVVAKVAGFTPFALHLFAMIIASAFSLFFFFLLRRFSNAMFAMLGTLALLSQEIFIVQSSFLLPEVFVSFVMFVTVFCLVERRLFWYLIAATVLVMTKETGLIILAALLFAAFFVSVAGMKKNKKTLLVVIKEFLLLLLPVWIAVAFYVLQKIECGWYFYPEHLQMLSFKADPFIPKLLLVRDFVFKAQGRIALSVIVVLVCFFLIYRRKMKTIQHSKFTVITWLLITVFIFYASFSALNFLMLRYLLPLVTIFIFLLSIWGYKSYLMGFRIMPYLLFVANCFSLYSNVISNRSWIDDVSINYKDDVTVHQQAVTFLESQYAQSKRVFTHFLVKYDLTHKELFYLHGVAFENVETQDVRKRADFYLFSNLELHAADYDYVSSNDSILFMKRFESGKAWCEIYTAKY